MTKDPFQLDAIEGREIKDLPDEFEEDWDEALIEGKCENQEVKTIKPVFNYRKFKWFSYIILLIFFLLGSRLFHMQIIAGDDYEEAAEENRYRIHVKRPSRGIIYDRNKNILIRNIPSFDIVLIPADLPKDNGQREELLNNLRNSVDISDDEFEDALKDSSINNYNTVLFKRNIERDKALQLKIELDQMPGVNIEINAIREYINSEKFAHIIGYTGKITDEELSNLDQEEYQYNDWIGKNGLEYYYEDEIRGKVGKEQVEVDSKGKVKEVVAVNQPEAGKDLMLTIDSELQKKVSGILENKLGEIRTNKAIAIAMNPNNGEILSMVSMPEYDNNLFAQVISNDDYSRLINDDDNPLFNRAVSGTYPPGSTIKPVVAIAALDEGIVTADTIINDTGSISVPHKYNPDIVYKFVGWDLSGLGPMNIFSAIAKSSDIYFYEVGGGYEEMKGLGVEKLGEYYSKFNLGAKTNIDLPGEKDGLIPNSEWKEKHKGEPWYLGDTYHMAIGQGDVLTTPLQVASWTATIANGGTIYQPYLAKKIIDKEGNVKEIMPKIIRDDFVSDNSVNISQQGMRETVLSGSAKSLQYLSFSSAGKTGTAQHSASEDYHAWYTSFAPYENPEIVVTVLVEEGGEGSDIAVPITGEILDWYFNHKKEK